MKKEKDSKSPVGPGYQGIYCEEHARRIFPTTVTDEAGNKVPYIRPAKEVLESEDIPDGYVGGPPEES